MTGNGGATMRKRNDWLDLWRSLAVLTMLVFHALWDLEHFGALPAGTMETPTADVVRWLGGGSFILISGILAPRSARSVRRGFILFCVGLGVSIISAAAGLPVKFGILQLLGVCKMLYGAVFARRGSAPGAKSALLWLALFIGAFILTARVTVQSAYLFPFGLRPAGFFSADYWPLLPWSFLFLLGTALQVGQSGGEEKRRLPAALTFPGRHSLVIYLLHQPVLYGLCMLLFRGKN